MSDTIKIALAQINPHVGAIEANLQTLRRARAEAGRLGADLVVTPQFSIAGYPPEDLVRMPDFLAACEAAIAALAADTADGGPAILVGGPWRDGDRLHDAAFLLDGGRIAARRARHEFRDDGVFGEYRVFDSGLAPGPVACRGFRLGILIAEDARFPAVAETLLESGAELLLCIDASPFAPDRSSARIGHAVARVVETGLPFVHLGQVGGQDELVFDGASFVLNADRSLAVQMPWFEERICLTEWRRAGGRLVCTPQQLAPEPERLEQIYRAMMLGLADHIRKNRFPGVVLGLSGGIGAALSAAVAVDALGADRVRGVSLPGPDNGTECLEDAAACAGLLGIRCDTIPIAGPIAGATEALAAALAPVPAPVLPLGQPDQAGRNIRARIRLLLLLAMAEEQGHLLLSAGDKSAFSTGEATPHGDLYGGYAVLKDVYRTTALALCRWRNANFPAGAQGPRGRVVPERVLASQLRTGPGALAFDVLDGILGGLIEDRLPADALIERGFARPVVLRAWRMLAQAEYQRRQAPPGVMMSTERPGPRPPLSRHQRLHWMD